MNKQKVLVVGAFPPPPKEIFGGIISSCKLLVKSSFSERFDLILVDSTQISNPPPPLRRRAVFAGRRLISFCKHIAISRPNAVLLFASPGASVLEKGAMAWISRLFRLPILVFPRGAQLIEIAAMSNFQRFWIRWSLKGATHFLCQGPLWQNFAINTIGFKPVNTLIVPNWTATDRLLEIGSQRSDRMQEGVVQLLFLGWLEKEKGVFDLLHACLELAGDYDFRLKIAGRGKAEAAARKLVKTSQLIDRVEFTGWVQGEMLEELFAESDVLVLPSWAEGLPNAMIEAMAAGLAVVVSAVGNIPHVVTDGQEALLVQPRQIASLKSAIKKLLDDPPLRVQLSARGHAFVRQNYSVEPAVAMLSEAVISAILSRKPFLQTTGNT